MYEPSGGAARALGDRRARAPRACRPRSAASSPKQVRAPVWQAGPAGSTTSSSASRSQSARASTHAQRVARGLALLPERLPAAAPEVREAGLGRARAAPRRWPTPPSARRRSRGPATTTGTSPLASKASRPGRDGVSARIRRPHLDARRARSRAFASGMRISPKWKIEAASAALAPPVGQHLRHVRDGAAAARGDHRHAHRLGHRAGERHVEAVLGAVAVHAGEQDLARAALAPSRAQATASGRWACGRRARRPPSRRAAPRGRRWPAPRPASRSAAPARSSSAGSCDGRGVHRHLVGAGAQQRVGVLQRAHAAADREGQEDRVGHAPHHVEHDRPRVRGGGDVEEHQLVGALGVVARRALHRDRRRRAGTRTARP